VQHLQKTQQYASDAERHFVAYCCEKNFTTLTSAEESTPLSVEKRVLHVAITITHTNFSVVFPFLCHSCVLAGKSRWLHTPYSPREGSPVSSRRPRRAFGHPSARPAALRKAGGCPARDRLAAARPFGPRVQLRKRVPAR